MTMTQAATGLGAELFIGNSTDLQSTNWNTKVGGLVSVKPPSVERDAIEVTEIDAPDDAAQFIAGLLRAGVVVLTINGKPGENDPLLTALLAGKIDLRIKYRGGICIDFAGVPTAWEPGEITTDKVTGSFSVQPSGLPKISRLGS